MAYYSKTDLYQDAVALAVLMLGPHEPGDSRAVSNEFVALAALSCGIIDEKVVKCIRDGLKTYTDARNYDEGSEASTVEAD